MKKLFFFGFDSVYGRFWVWGEVVVIGLLLEWRKAPFWTQSSFLSPPSQSALYGSIEEMEL